MLIILVLLSYIAYVNCHSESIKNEDECKIADLCVHDKVPMCGIDSCGEMRTFIDTCDMHEFNCDSKKLAEECKIADICKHDQVPMCGIDSCGEMRTFIDACDMHEFNCDSKKDFEQKPVHECWVTCKRGRSFKKPAYGTDCVETNLV